MGFTAPQEVEMSKEMYEEVIKELDKALNAPKRWRRKFIMWVFPEIIPVAAILKDYYWAEHCPHCGSTNLKNPDQETSHYCNNCHRSI